MTRRRILILGAAGRDFHVFNTVYRTDPNYEVVAFTAAQIPDIAGRRYPAVLAGPHYPEGIPIEAEEELERLIPKLDIDEAVFAYSDVPFDHLGKMASRVIAAGAQFTLLPDKLTMLDTVKPVVAVCAIRTGCGKSQTSRYIAQLRGATGKRVATMRHPMPYGDLAAQAVQAFRTMDDMVEADCTIEEREEYEPYIEMGMSIFAGVDYEAILREAEKEADIVLWDGGNNDTSFVKTDLHITVLDPLRAGHETAYHPGMVNLLIADAFVINKCDSATEEQIQAVEAAAAEWCPDAPVIRATSVLDVTDEDAVKGKRVLCIEDGPTLTHGEMNIGAAYVAAERLGATIVDPRPFAVGSIAEAYTKYPHLGPVVPALGYYPKQLEELQQTIAAADVDTIVVGTPIDLGAIVEFARPSVRVSYRLEEIEGQNTTLSELISKL